MTPPPLPWTARTAPERFILVFTGAVVLGAVTVLSAGCFLPFGWVCAWKFCTGLPCAGCGATRAMLLAARGDWFAAFCMNPGATLGMAALAVLNLYAFGILALRLPPWRPSVRGWRWILGAAVALNWFYLLAAGRA